jgi:hypothetical protein
MQIKRELASLPSRIPQMKSKQSILGRIVLVELLRQNGLFAFAEVTDTIENQRV